MLDRMLGWVGLQRKPPERPIRRNLYQSAMANRLTADWVFTPITSATKEIQADFVTLRGRARDLARNNPYITRFLGLLEENVVGPEGIRLQSRIEKLDGSGLDRASVRKIEEAWRDWGRRGIPTADGRVSWAGLQRLLIRTWATDGEFFLRVLEGFPNEWGFALQVVDADQVDHQFTRNDSRLGNPVRLGVEVNEWERPVRYHVWKHHPSEHDRRDRVRLEIDARDMIHQFLPSRATQARGVTWFASVMLAAHIDDGYVEAELVNSRTAASKMGIFFLDPEAEPDPDDPEAHLDEEFVAEPGTFDIAPPGVRDFKPWDPQHPTSQFEAFRKSILRGIASGLRTSYAPMAGDLREVNYSSIRAGLLADRDVYRILQGSLAEDVFRPVFRRWLRWAITSGQLRMPMRQIERLAKHRWQARGWDWVDPLKDAQARAAEVEMGVNSLTRIAAERGREIEDVFEERRREIELAEEMGVPLGFTVAQAINVGGDDDEGGDDGDDATGAGQSGSGGGSGAVDRTLVGAGADPARRNGNGRGGRRF